MNLLQIALSLQDPTGMIKSQNSIYKKDRWLNQGNQTIVQTVRNKTPVNLFEGFPPPGGNSGLSFGQVLSKTGNPIILD